MSEGDLSDFKILQEFSHGPSIMASAHAFSELRKNKPENKIYCIEEKTAVKIWFWVVANARYLNRRSAKGNVVRVVEIDVMRCDDLKEGSLVFIEGHRHATFFEKNKEITEEVVAHLEATD